MTHRSVNGRRCFEVCERRWRSDVVEVMFASSFRHKPGRCDSSGWRRVLLSAAVSGLPPLLPVFIGLLAARDKRCCARTVFVGWSPIAAARAQDQLCLLGLASQGGGFDQLAFDALA